MTPRKPQRYVNAEHDPQEDRVGRGYFDSGYGGRLIGHACRQHFLPSRYAEIVNSTGSYSQPHLSTRANRRVQNLGNGFCVTARPGVSTRLPADDTVSIFPERVVQAARTIARNLSTSAMSSLPPPGHGRARR